MKTLKFTLVIIFFSQLIVAQSKNDILEQIDIYRKSIYFNKPYDVDRSKLFEAMNQAIAPEYQKILRESESRGFCEYYAEGDTFKETLTAEIANDKQPYRVSFSIKKEVRTKNYMDGSYSAWQTTYEIPQRYLSKLQYGIFVALFGPIKLPDDLQSKIDNFNEAQTKERKKIIQGRDY